MSSEDIRISKQFCKFCIRTLKNEAVDFHRENAKLREREKSLNELAGCLTKIPMILVLCLVISAATLRASPPAL